jgi:hypothetical protein
MPTSDARYIPYGVAYLEAVLEDGPESDNAARAYHRLVKFLVAECRELTLGERQEVDWAWQRWIEEINNISRIH